MDEPKVFALPLGVDFAAAVLAGLRARVPAGDPLALARCRIIVNTERAARRFAAVAESGAVALPPRITVLTALPREVPGLPPEKGALARRLELAQLVRGLLAADPLAGARASAYPLADTLAALLGEMRIEGVDLAALHALSPQDQAGHWQRALRFLGLIGEILEAPAEAATDGEHRLALALAARAADWAARPPEGPVVVAGSTGSRGATARFMAAVARLPQGAAVLPGVDTALPADVWAVLTGPDAPQDHPQSAIARFCAAAGADPARLPAWDAGAPAPAPGRNAVLSLALRPAPVTDQWLRDGPALAPGLAADMRGVTLLEARDTVEEATAIAVALRRALAEGRSAALVTPDRTLARRVTAALDRWEIRPDDSAGRPLGQTPPGVFLRLTAALLVAPPDPVSLVALLKHPLAGGSGAARGRHLGAVRRLEAVLRRSAGPAVTGDTLRGFAEAAQDADFAAWLRWLAGLLPAPLAGDVPLPELVARHRPLAEGLAAGPALWEAEAGRKAEALWTRLEEAAPAGGLVPAAEYPVLLRAILSRVEVPPEPFVPTPGLSIWGTLEARTLTADLVILGSLAEGLWPRLPEPDPWLSRQMRAAAGLPLPERQIGLSAHDFQQAAAAREVILSCPRRDGEAPTVPSRWLLRLTNLLGGLGKDGKDTLAAMRARGAEILALARALDRPDAPVPRAPRPAPVPPAEAFPERLPVTQIEKLLTDPYAVYARYILGLRPADPLLRAADARERGNSMHEVLERFVRETWEGLPENAAEVFDRAIEETLAATVPWPTARAFWSRRFAALREGFLAAEAARREIAPPRLLETEGRVRIEEGLPRPFTLTAKADRVDAGGEGPVAIYDYKGALPSAAAAKRFAPQLPLEAAIAARGGFPEIGPRETAALALIGTKPPGEIREIPADREAVETVWAAFLALVATYQGGGQPYPARAREQSFDGDYDHLARFGEWEDTDPVTEEPVP